MMTATKSVPVLVTGDCVLDHHIYEGRRYHYGDHRNRGVQEVEELGGAALVHYLLTELKGGLSSYLSVKIDRKRKPLLPARERVPSGLNAYAVWRPFGLEGDKSPEKQVWRTEDAMGFGDLPEAAQPYEWPVTGDLPKRPDVVVLSDGGMGFRSEQEAWPKDPVLSRARWIVLKTAQPLAEGDLWKHLTKDRFRSKLVVIASATGLRKSAAQISIGLSWDAMVESALNALAPGGELAALTRCRHLLVTFGTEGGLWLEVRNRFVQSRVHLVYDADAVEGEHLRPDKGTAFGALSCLTAAVASYLARGGNAPDLEAALEGGLSAIHDLLSNGHGRAASAGAGFPAARLAKVIGKATCRYARTAFDAKVVFSPKCPASKPSTPGIPCWSVMHEALRQQGQGCPEPAWNLAELVAQYGPIALGSLPHLSIGKLLSADRREIESLRVLCRLIQEYKERPASACKKPLAVGVFGAPGAGKSFAVKEIARTLLGKEGWMEFNLSQFKPGTDDLIGSFHQIRDRVLQGQIPVAFFDEFDSRDYGWLQYLLAPMQDGAFQEGQITHPIGKCVFIFAGGTSETFDSFGPPRTNSEAYAQFQMAKGPDFKSRLDGFLDILGPNRREIITVKAEGQDYDHAPDPCDIFYPVRRAFVIRAELGCQPTDRLMIDSGLLQAMLRVGRYIHGARSLGKVIGPLKAAYPGMIYRSLLAPRQQLALYVDAEEFLENCKATAATRVTELGPARDRVAIAIHETWRRLGKKQGWLDPTNDVDFRCLSKFYQNSNLAAADRMVTTLALIGLCLRAGKGTAPERDAIRLKLEYNLELLAEREHANWMEWHLDQGWQYAPEKGSSNLTKEPEKKTHPCLCPYTALPDVDRNKDRDTIRHYPDFAAAAGMKIVPM